MYVIAKEGKGVGKELRVKEQGVCVCVCACAWVCIYMYNVHVCVCDFPPSIVSIAT